MLTHLTVISKAGVLGLFAACLVGILAVCIIQLINAFVEDKE